MEDQIFDPSNFDKVKLSPSQEKGRVWFERPLTSKADQTDSFKVVIPDLPADPLIDALDGLTQHYLDTLDLDNELQPLVDIIGVQITDRESLKIRVFGKRELTHGQTIGQAAPPRSPIDQDTFRSLDTIIEETIRYVGGKRRNLDLFKDYGPEGKAEPAPADAEQIEDKSSLEGIESNA